LWGRRICNPLVPAEAGTQLFGGAVCDSWIPACAGMNGVCGLPPQNKCGALRPRIVVAPKTGAGQARASFQMLIRRVSTDQTGAHIELSHLLLRGDRSRFLLERRVRDAWAGAPLDRQPTEAPTPSSDRIAASLLIDA